MGDKRTKLFLHIGAGKCGSTTIQQFLALNAQKLRELGYLVPASDLTLTGTVTGDHIWFFERLIGGDAAASQEVLNRLLAIRETAGGDIPYTILLSAENLSEPRGAERLFDLAARHFDIFVVMYIRRQDEYLDSAWRQWWLKTHPDLWSWVIQNRQRIGNWRTSLSPWIEAFGRERVTVRLFDRSMFIGNDLLTDFSAAVGLPFSELSPFGNEFNKGVNNLVAHMAASIRDTFADIHDNDFYQMMRDAAGDRADKQPGESIFTPDQRQAILSLYADSNAWVYQNFFPNPDKSGVPFAYDPASTRGPQTLGPIDPVIGLLVRVNLKQHRALAALDVKLDALARENARLAESLQRLTASAIAGRDIADEEP